MPQHKPVCLPNQSVPPTALAHLSICTHVSKQITEGSGDISICVDNAAMTTASVSYLNRTKLWVSTTTNNVFVCDIGPAATSSAALDTGAVTSPQQ